MVPFRSWESRAPRTGLDRTGPDRTGPLRLGVEQVEGPRVLLNGKRVDRTGPVQLPINPARNLSRSPTVPLKVTGSSGFPDGEFTQCEPVTFKWSVSLVK